MSYKTMKVFNYCNIPDDIFENGFFEQYPENHGSGYYYWSTCWGLEHSYCSNTLGHDMLSQWLIDNGAEENETVLIHYDY